MASSDASVIVPHYGSCDRLRETLESIQLTTRAVEVVVVDNGTGHEISADVVIRNNTNHGFARACNAGAAAASGDNLVFLNNDACVTGAWLALMVDNLSDPKVGIVGCQIVDREGALLHAGVEVWRSYRQMKACEIRRPRPGGTVTAVTAACVLIRRRAFEEVGGFDEGYWNGYEDVDLCLAVGKAGWSVRYEPDAVVRHRTGESTPERWSRSRENEARLFEKWAGKVRADRYAPPADWVKRFAVHRLPGVYGVFRPNR